MRWIMFFLGSPQRLLGTVAAGLVIASLIDVKLPSFIFNQAMQAFGPIVGPLLQIAVVFFGIRVILFGWPGGNRRNRN